MRIVASVLCVMVIVGFAPGVDPVVPNAHTEIQPLIDKHLSAAQVKTLKELALANGIPALAKAPVRMKGVADPWGAMTELEKSGLNIAEKAKAGLVQLPALLDALGGSLGKPAGLDV